VDCFDTFKTKVSANDAEILGCNIKTGFCFRCPENYHYDNFNFPKKCVFDILNSKDCKKGKKIWDKEKKSWGPCNIKDCQLENGFGEKDFVDGQWGECILKKCNFGYEIKAKTCKKINYPDLKSCKLSFYQTESKKDLGLKDQNWCGELNRFKLINNQNDYIYDQMLRGFWSKKIINKTQFGSPKPYFFWTDIKNQYCQKVLGQNWQLPTVYQLISLASSSFTAEVGYSNPLFNDNFQGLASNDSIIFWSHTIRPNSSLKEGILISYLHPSSKSSVIYDRLDGLSGQVRCFRPLKTGEKEP